MAKINSTKNIVIFRKIIALIFSVATFIFVYKFFVTTLLGQLIDTLGMLSLNQKNKSLIRWELEILITYYNYIVATLAIIALLIILFRSCFVLGMRMALMVACACLTTQLLKHYVLIRPSLGVIYYMHNSLPSGHTTCVGALASAIVILTARKWRTFAVVCMSIVVAVVASAVLVARWHRGSDVLAALLVVFFFTVLFAPAQENNEQKRCRLFTSPITWILLIFAGAVAVLWICTARMQEIIPTLIKNDAVYSLLSMSDTASKLAYLTGISTLILCIVSIWALCLLPYKLCEYKSSVVVRKGNTTPSFYEEPSDEAIS